MKRKNFEYGAGTLSYPNALKEAYWLLNTCTAHVRDGQATIDEWGARQRRSKDCPLPDATAYYDNEGIKWAWRGKK